MPKLLADFQQFYRKNATGWLHKFPYRESAYQLLIQAYLQRIVNGGGFIDREYGLGRGRTDLLITKKLTEGYGGPEQRIVLELKVRRKEKLETLITEGLPQTYQYMDQLGNIAEGHLVIFDSDLEKTWEERIFHEEREYNGVKIGVWGM